MPLRVDSAPGSWVHRWRVLGGALLRMTFCKKEAPGGSAGPEGPI